MLSLKLSEATIAESLITRPTPAKAALFSVLFFNLYICLWKFIMNYSILQLTGGHITANTVREGKKLHRLKKIAKMYTHKYQKFYIHLLKKKTEKYLSCKLFYW